MQQFWRVIGSGGAVLRSTAALESDIVGQLSAGEVVEVVAVEGRRAQLASPVRGWASVTASTGEPILAPLGAAATSPAASPLGGPAPPTGVAPAPGTAAAASSSGGGSPAAPAAAGGDCFLSGAWQVRTTACPTHPDSAYCLDMVQDGVSLRGTYFRNGEDESPCAVAGWWDAATRLCEVRIQWAEGVASTLHLTLRAAGAGDGAALHGRFTNDYDGSAGDVAVRLAAAERSPAPPPPPAPARAEPPAGYAPEMVAPPPPETVAPPPPPPAPLNAADVPLPGAVLSDPAWDLLRAAVGRPGAAELAQRLHSALCADVAAALGVGGGGGVEPAPGGITLRAAPGGDSIDKLCSQYAAMEAAGTLLLPEARGVLRLAEAALSTPSVVSPPRPARVAPGGQASCGGFSR